MSGFIDGIDPLDEGAPEKPRRDNRGRFRKGSSGNPNGKAFDIPRDPNLPASRRRIVSQVADEEIDAKVNGKPRKITMYEANVRSLAHAGIKDRVAAQRFIDLVTETSEKSLERRLRSREFLEQMNALYEENQRLKKQHEPSSGVVVLGPEEFDKWQAERMLDDEEGVAEAISGSAPKR